jgi:hypothetical protein
MLVTVERGPASATFLSTREALAMNGPRIRKVLSAAVVALTVLAGCADGNGGEEATTAPTTAPTTTTLPVSSTTAPPPSTTGSTTASGGGSCPGDDPVPPEGAEDISEASVDVDGDGADDRVLAYRRSDGDRRVAVDLAAGGTAAVDASASEIEGPAPLSVLGGAQVGGDGETVFALTGAGASVVIVGLFQFVECALSRVTFESGEDVELPVSGAITHGDGIACTDDTLVRLSATSTDGETFTATDTNYQVDGNTLVETSSNTTTLTRATDDEAINAYYSINCPTLDNSIGTL